MSDGRKRRTEANQLRRSIFGKKHDRLDESKVRPESEESFVAGLIKYAALEHIAVPDYCLRSLEPSVTRHSFDVGSPYSGAGNLASCYTNWNTGAGLNLYMTNDCSRTLRYIGPCACLISRALSTIILGVNLTSAVLAGPL